MNELLPCPFCGGEALLRERFLHGIANKKGCRHECRACHATFTSWFHSPEKAATFWNRRAQPVAGNPATENKPIATKTGEGVQDE